MPEYQDQDQDQDQELEEEQEAGHCIPTLFPARLLDSCLAKVQGLVYTTGVEVEARARTEQQLAHPDQ